MTTIEVHGVMVNPETITDEWLDSIIRYTENHLKKFNAEKERRKQKKY